VFIDVGDQRQVVVSSAPLELVDANRLNPGEFQVLTAPAYRHLDRAEDLLPARSEDLGDLLAAQPLGPACQEPCIGLRQAVFALGPEHPLHPYPAAPTRPMVSVPAPFVPV
jgi:hypothetical protein